jgi:hypothetical protein
MILPTLGTLKNWCVRQGYRVAVVVCDHKGTRMRVADPAGLVDVVSWDACPYFNRHTRLMSFDRWSGSL